MMRRSETLLLYFCNEGNLPSFVDEFLPFCSCEGVSFLA
jgi:hypothetical protein